MKETRREILKKLAASGIGLTVIGGAGTGVASAKKNTCPPGTRLLAKYEVSGCSLEFEKGEDVVQFTVPDEFCVEGELKGFEFETVDGPDPDSAPETATVGSIKYGPNTDVFEPSLDDDKRSGTVDLTDERNAISNVVFCQGAYAQVDFVKGDVIDDLCNDQYSDRRISAISWGSYEGQLDGAAGKFDGNWAIDDENGTVTVNYNDDYGEKVALAVYRVSDPVFQDNDFISFSDTRCRQTLEDSAIDDSGNEGTLTANLPSP